MSSVPGFPSSGASSDFSVVHEILRNHVRLGNNFSVLAALSLPIVHEDPSFWRTCDYHGGLAAAAIASTLERADAEPLSPGELHALLRRAGGAADPLLRRAMERLELPAGPRVDLAEVCAVLQESRAGKRPREEGGGGAPEQPGETNGEETADEEEAVGGALGVLARLPVLPGSKRFAASFDEVGEVDASESKSKPVMAARLSIAHEQAVNNVNAQRAPVMRPAAHMHTNLTNIHVQALRGAAAHTHVSSHATSISSSHFNAYPSGSENDDNLTRALRHARGGPQAPITIPQRQRRYKFTKEEDDAILQGIGRFAPGPGRFDSIFAAYRDVWHPCRTGRQLYDHWRGTLRNRAVLQEDGYRRKNSLAFGNNGNSPMSS